MTTCRRMGAGGAGGSVLSAGGDDGIMAKETIPVHGVCRGTRNVARSSPSSVP